MAAHPLENNPAEDVTTLLRAWRNGEAGALTRLVPLIHDELRSLARYYLSQERHDHTLQTTALVHEAYLRLLQQRQSDWQDRAHFYRLAAKLMREILVDHARKHLALKRGGLLQKVSLTEAGTLADEGARNITEIIAVHEALKPFAAKYPRAELLVELRYFAGLTVTETAETLGVNPATVVRDWRFAKSWLRQYLEQGGAGQVSGETEST